MPRRCHASPIGSSGQQIGLGRPHAPRVVGAKETFSAELGDDREHVDVTFDQSSRRQVGPADIDEGLPPELRRARARKRKLRQWRNSARSSAMRSRWLSVSSSGSIGGIGGVHR